MRLAIVGAGMVVRDFLTAAPDLPEIELVAIVGRESARAGLEGLTAEHGIGRVYTELDACLSDPDVDTVYVALPNHLHHATSRAALLAGKHVICEKPFTLTLEEFDELRRIARAAGLNLTEAVTTVHLPAFRALPSALSELGDLRLIQCGYSQRSSRYDAFTRGEVHPAFDPAIGGGALMDLGIYTVHLVVGLLGPPTTLVYAANIDRGVDTSGMLVLGYDGAKAVCLFAKDSEGPSRTVVQGAEGYLEMDGSPNVCPGFTLAVRGRGPRPVAGEPTHRMVPEFRAFARMIRDRDRAERDRLLEHSRSVLEVVTEARRGSAVRRGDFGGLSVASL